MQVFEDYLINDFVNNSIPYRDMREYSFYEKRIHAQHYGLPTRLLDWTANPLVALYFAVENPQHDEQDGMVFMFCPSVWFNGITGKPVANCFQVILPEQANDRILAQSGCFTSFPLPEGTDDTILPLCMDSYPHDVDWFDMVNIPSNAKHRLRVQLNRLGVNSRFLFPGLEDTAKWIRSRNAGFMC